MKRFKGLASVVVAGMVLLSVQSASAQDMDEPTQKNIVRPNSIGVAAGYVSGFGLSYRHWFDNSTFGLQVTATPVYSESKENDTKYINASLGILGLTKLHQGSFADLFLYYGGHIWKYYDKTHETLYSYDSYYNQTTRDTVLIDDKTLVQAGIGPGVELHLGRVCYNIMVGMRGGYDLVNEDKFVKITAETALYYNF